MVLEFWNKCSEKLENKLSQDDFNTWIRPLKANLNENVLELVAPNDFILKYVESNLTEEITNMVKQQSKKDINLVFKTHTKETFVDKYKNGNKRKYYTNILINKFKKLTGIKIKKIYFTHIHGWKYSSNSKAINVKSYWDKKCGLGICADWFGGPRLENGWLSANDLYAKIIK